MNRRRNKEEITASGYMKQAELKRIYGYANGRKLYQAALQIDADELGSDRVIQNMVRIKSVLKVIGIKKTV